MLPPIPPSVLERNPRFNQLYKDISPSRLNPDATTRLIKQQRAQADIEKQLQVLRKEALQIDVLRNAFLHIAKDLPSEIRMSCMIVAGNLRGGLSSTELEILNEVIEPFNSNVKSIGAAISASLKHLVASLASLIAAEEGREIKPSDLTQVPANSAKLLSQNVATAQKIAQLRTRVTDLSDQINSTHREILEASVRILEQTLHGSVARGMRAKAEHLAVVAKGLDLKIRILDAGDPLRSNGELRAALDAYGEHLGDLRRKLEGRVRELEGEMQGYESEGGLKEIGKRFADVLGKCEDVKREIARLEGERVNDPAGGVD